MLNKILKQDGITLVALVVTIIILIILATISINVALGDNGMIKMAQQAKNIMEQSMQQEQEELKELENILEGESSDENIPEKILKIKAELQNAQTEYKLGSKISYLVTIENTSNVTLNDITIYCRLDGANGNLTYDNLPETTENGDILITTLGKGQSKSFKCIYEVTREDAGAVIYLKAEASLSHPIDKDEIITVEGETDDCAYIENLYTLTILYVYEDGTEAAPTYEKQYLANESYNITSPEIAGYTPDTGAFVGQMPSMDITQMVTYKKAI